MKEYSDDYLEKYAEEQENKGNGEDETKEVDKKGKGKGKGKGKDKKDKKGGKKGKRSDFCLPPPLFLVGVSIILSQIFFNRIQ